LHQCIESLIGQTYKNIEIILVNDGSTDSSGDICDSFAEKDCRITVINKTNGGLSDARNQGTKQATGEYIIYVDSDDWMNKETCHVSLKAAIENNADIVFWGFKKEFSDGVSKEVNLFDKDRVFLGESSAWLHRRLVGLVGNELSNPVKTDAYNSAWAKLYKRHLIYNNNITFIDTKEVGSEDVLFNIEAFFRAKKIVYLNALFNHYRQNNPNALTKNHNSTLFPRFLNLFRQIEVFIKSNKLPQDYYTALNNRIALSIINNSLSITWHKNPDSFFKKFSSLRSILQNQTYSVAVKKLDIKQLPIYWQLFFIFCKLRFTPGVYFLTLIMRKLR